MSNTHNPNTSFTDGILSAFFQTPEAMYIEDFDGKILEVNEATCLLHNKTREELIGSYFYHLAPDEEKERMMGRFEELFQLERSSFPSFTYNEKMEEIPVMIYYQKLRTSEGKEVAFFRLTDISEQKKVERRGYLLQSLVNEATDALYVFDYKTAEIVDCNPKSSELLGYTKEEVLKLHPGQINPNVKNWKIVQDRLAETGSYNYINAHYHKSGYPIPVELFVKEVTYEKHRYVLVTARDLREQLKKKEESDKLNHTYQTLVTKLPHGLVQSDEEGKITFVNDKICKMLELSEADILGKTLKEILIRKHDVRKTVELLNVMKNTGKGHRFEHEFQLSTGKISWLEVTGIPLKNENGYHGSIAVVEDITPKKIAEITMREKKDELETLIYKASHDLKGPIATILGLTHIALNETQEASAIQYLELINKTADRLDVALLGLIEATMISQITPSVSAFNVQEFCQKCVQRFKQDHAEMDIEFHLQYEAPSIFPLDIKLFQTILEALIENAVVFRDPEKGSAMVFILLEEGEHHYILHVKDNGVGIAKNIKEKVFQMFYRGNIRSKGSGLGLYLVKTAVEKLNGHCKIQSRENVGTTISVYFPKKINA